MTHVTPGVDEATTGRDDNLDWIGDLTCSGPSGEEALLRLRDVALRASRHQVWRLRDLLPGIGAGDLEDLAQQAANDATVAVLGKLDTFEGRSQFTTWVYKFGILHAGTTVRRQAWRRRELPFAEHLDPTDAAATPAALTESRDLAHAVQTAIAENLTPHQRAVTIALLIDHVPIDVLADHLGTSRNALYKTLHDARQNLRKALTASGHLGPTAHGALQ